MPSAVVLVIDGLGARSLGPYGNTWIETRAFNRLAGEALLAEQAYAAHADPGETCAAWWRGADVFGAAGGPISADGLLAGLNSRGVTTTLLSDAPAVMDHALAADFREHIELPPSTATTLAREWDETHTARFFAEALSVLESMRRDSLLWIHAHGLGNPWDAPPSYRRQFADEDDPDPTDSVEVPHLRFDADFDPDALHAITCRWAGQIVLIDQCLDVLLTQARETARKHDLLLVVTSPRGFPRGQHLNVGWTDASLHGELLHVPLLLRYPNLRGAMRRGAELTEPRDLTLALWNWLAAEDRDEFRFPRRSHSISLGDAEMLLRTRCWQACFRRAAGRVSPPARLYLKPDDRTEVNDVADRCGDVTAAAQALLQSCLDDPTRYDKLELPAILNEPLE